MTTRLDSFLKHCEQMAAAEHKPNCPMLTAKEPFWDSLIPSPDGRSMYWRGPKPPWNPPHCDGCNPTADREMFAMLARQVADYQQEQIP